MCGSPQRSCTAQRRAYRLKEWSDCEDFLTQLAQKAGKLLKGGEPDLNTAARWAMSLSADAYVTALPALLAHSHKSERRSGGWLDSCDDKRVPSNSYGVWRP